MLADQIESDGFHLKMLPHFSPASQCEIGTVNFVFSFFLAVIDAIEI